MNGFEFLRCETCGLSTPRSVYTGDPLSDSGDARQCRSRCDHARRNRWTRETTTPSSRSLDGRIKADDDVGSWEKGLILARSILTAVKEERVRKFPFQGIVSRGIRGNSSVFFWLSRGRNKSNYRRNVSSEFEDRVNIQSSIKSLFCRMEKQV